MNRRDVILGATALPSLAACATVRPGEASVWHVRLIRMASPWYLPNTLRVEADGSAEWSNGEWILRGRVLDWRAGSVAVDFPWQETAGQQGRGRLSFKGQMDSADTLFGLVDRERDGAEGQKFFVQMRRGGDRPIEPLTLASLEQKRAMLGVPAIFAGAGRRNEPNRLWAAGVRQQGMKTPVREDDLCCIGSITKPFTATLAARLVETGMVSWSDTIGDVLGSHAPQVHEGYRGQSLLKLLRHRAGVPRDATAAEATVPMEDIVAARRQFAANVLARAPETAAGTMSYSNSGYAVAAAMMEAKTGRPFEAMMREMVLQPLGLSRATFDNPPKLDGSETAGHMGRESWMFLPEWPSNMTPVVDRQPDFPLARASGGLRMPIADLLAFLRAHAEGHAILKPETWRFLHTPPDGSDYAVGWDVTDDGALTHGGALRGWMSWVKCDPASGAVAAVSISELNTMMTGWLMSDASLAAWAAASAG